MFHHFCGRGLMVCCQIGCNLLEVQLITAYLVMLAIVTKIAVNGDVPPSVEVMGFRIPT